MKKGMGEGGGGAAYCSLPLTPPAPPHQHQHAKAAEGLLPLRSNQVNYSETGEGGKGECGVSCWGFARLPMMLPLQSYAKKEARLTMRKSPRLLDMK